MRSCLAPTFATVALLFPAGFAVAGGSNVGEHGGQAFQRAGAFTAKADDATATFHNPAGLGKLKRVEATFGISLVQSSTTFQRQGSYAPDAPQAAGDPYPAVSNTNGPSLLPSIALAIPFDKFAIGLGVYTPHGAAGGDFPEVVITQSGAVAPAPQRYDFVNAGGIIAYPTVSAAYSITEALRVGIRLSGAFADVGQRLYTQALPNEGERRELDAVAEVKVKDPFAFHFGVGAQYQVGSFEFGVNYSSAIRFDLKGNADIQLGDGIGTPAPGVEIGIKPVPDDQAKCAPGGQMGAIKTCLDLIIPQTLNVGARWVARDATGREHGDIEFDVRWEDWSATSETVATIDGMDTVLQRPLGTSRSRNGLKDSYGFRLGGAKILRPANYDFILRGGIGYDTESSPLTWTRVNTDGAPKLTLNSGVGFDFERWRIDVGFAYIVVPTRTVNDEPLPADADQADRVQPDVPAGGLAGSGTPYNPYNAGTYDRSYFMGSLGVAVRF